MSEQIILPWKHGPSSGVVRGPNDERIADFWSGKHGSAEFYADYACRVANSFFETAVPSVYEVGYDAALNDIAAWLKTNPYSFLVLADPLNKAANDVASGAWREKKT